MAIDPFGEEPRRPKDEIVIGQDLATHSVDELTVRIATLEAEIARTKEALAQKEASRNAASSFFKA